jgi:hypothetical protein
MKVRMGESYTHYWRGSTCLMHEENGWEGIPLDHVAGSMFLQRGVSVGDRIYAVTVRQGELYLLARMGVEKIVLSDSEARRLLDYEPWSAPEHLIGSKDVGTPLSFNMSVPLPVLRKLRFEGPNGPVPPFFREPGKLDQQTLRGVRKLTVTSARLLEEMLAG